VFGLGLWLFSLLLPGLTQAATAARSGVLGEGSAWETRWNVVESGRPGATVLVVGGIHGNEPAGSHAAEQIRHWPIVRGRLVILPRANQLGLEASMRWPPPYRNDRDRRDLNRNFPTSDKATASTPLGKAMWSFVQEHRPDWILDLQEGFDFHISNRKSVGSSIIAFPAQAKLASVFQTVVNTDMAADRQFVVLAKRGPVRGSLARACHEHLGTKAFIFETTTKNQPVSLRARQHRILVSAALQHAGLVEQDCRDWMLPAATLPQVRVGVFDAAGANEAKVMRVVKDQAELIACHVGPGDLQHCALEQFDVLIFPGGSGSKQGRAIGKIGRDRIRAFVRDGGGVIGICAGAYLCSSHYRWSLDLMNAAVFNTTFDIPGKGRKSMWYRGPAADVEVEIAADGESILGIAGLHKVRYENGPILSPGNDPGCAAFKSLAFFRSENGIYEQQKGTMLDAPAVVVAQFGKGRVMAFSPHFEATKGKESVMLRAIQYVKRSEKKPLPKSEKGSSKQVQNLKS
jgi:predicted deacylase